MRRRPAQPTEVGVADQPVPHGRSRAQGGDITLGCHGAVAADESGDLAGRDVERDIIDGYQVADPAGEV